MAEAWLRGPVAGVPTELMPAAHSLIDAVEEVETAVADLDTDSLWLRPGGAASIGFHLRHSRGSIRRLLKYARGDQLEPDEVAEIRHESEPGTPPAEAGELLAGLRGAVDDALDRYRQTGIAELDGPRKVGRAELPSTTRGLLFHLADHTRRHAGQIVTTTLIIRGLDFSRISISPGPDRV